MSTLYDTLSCLVAAGADAALAATITRYSDHAGAWLNLLSGPIPCIVIQRRTDVDDAGTRVVSRATVAVSPARTQVANTLWRVGAAISCGLEIAYPDSVSVRYSVTGIEQIGETIVLEAERITERGAP